MTTGVLAAIAACPLEGSFESRLERLELPEVCSAEVLAPEGRGSEAALTG
jgi:hypothetical protein